MAKTKRKTFLLDFEKPLSELESRIEQIKTLAEENQVDVSTEISQLEVRAGELRQEIFSTLTPAQRLQLARHPRRPRYFRLRSGDSATNGFELHGDSLVAMTTLL